MTSESTSTVTFTFFPGIRHFAVAKNLSVSGGISEVSIISSVIASRRSKFVFVGLFVLLSFISYQKEVRPLQLPFPFTKIRHRHRRTQFTISDGQIGKGDVLADNVILGESPHPKGFISINVAQ